MDKSPEVYERVLKVKLDGTDNILNALPGRLDNLIAFTSVLGASVTPDK